MYIYLFFDIWRQICIFVKLITKSMHISERLKKIFTLRTIIGIVAGGALGFSYFYFYGCEGSCGIWSSPYLSTGFGILFGGVLLSK